MSQGDTIHYMQTIHVHRWTFENFKRFVEHEAMFHDTCVREDTADGADVKYRLTRKSTGYNGFAVDVGVSMYLHGCDGPVPPMGVGAAGTLV